MKNFKEVTVVYDFDDEDQVIAIYDNPDHADEAYPWNYKEKKFKKITPDLNPGESE